MSTYDACYSKTTLFSMMGVKKGQLSVKAWREALELKGCKINWSKTETMECRYTNTRKEDMEQLISRESNQKRQFHYLRKIVHKE